MSYPTWTPVTVAASTYCSAGLISNFMVQLSLMQQDFKNAIYEYSSLASFVHSKQDPNSGNWASVFHVSLIGVTAGQHHPKVHATKHLSGASDAIQLAATNAARGLETTTQFKKINTLEASSTRNLFRASSYVGNGTSQVINLGVAPRSFQAIAMGSQGPMFEFMRNSSKAVKHVVAAATVHFRLANSAVFASTATGILVRGSANTVSVKYFYFAKADYKT